MVSKRYSDTPNFAVKDLLKKIGKEKTSREYCNQGPIFKQRDVADAMFYIQDGSVESHGHIQTWQKGSFRYPPAERLFLASAVS